MNAGDTTVSFTVTDATTPNLSQLEGTPFVVLNSTLINEMNGTIIIRKVTDPDNRVSFDFSDDIAAPNSFSLSSGSEKTFLSVPTGQYTVTEAERNPAFQLRLLTCVDSDAGGTTSTGDVAARTATINLDPDETVTCTFTNSNKALAVSLGWFLAERDGDTVDFRWQTATETGTAGFNVLAESDGGTVQLNTELIPSPVIDSVEPTDYQFSLVTDATQFYLQEVEISGLINELGPFDLGQAYGVRTTSSNGVLTPTLWFPTIQSSR